MKKKNKKNLVKRIVLVLITIILSIGFGFLAYYGTYEIDKANKKGEVKIKVTFDDTMTYVIPSIQKMEKEEALKEWPYIFKIENSGDIKGLYQIHLLDVEDDKNEEEEDIEEKESNLIKRENLDYALYMDDVEVLTGKLSDMKDNLLYTSSIEGEKTQEFKLYIWVNDDVLKDSKYEYKIEFTVIRDGGPGF